MYILLYKSTHVSETRILGAWHSETHATKYAIHYFFENNMLDTGKCDRTRLQSVFNTVNQYNRTPESIKQIFIDNLVDNYTLAEQAFATFGKNVVDWDTGATLWGLSINYVEPN